MEHHLEQQENPVCGDPQQPTPPAAGAAQHDDLAERQPAGPRGPQRPVLTTELIVQNSAFVKSVQAIRQVMQHHDADMRRVQDTALAGHRQVANAASLAADLQSIVLPKAELVVPPLRDLGSVARGLTQAVQDVVRAGQAADSVMSLQQTLPLVVAKIADIKAIVGTPALVNNLDHVRRTIIDTTQWALRPALASADEYDRVLRALLRAAAREARDAFLLSGDPESVAEFAFGWLGSKPAGGLRTATLNAVAEVVISEQWPAWDTLDMPQLRTLHDFKDFLRRKVKAAHMHWRDPQTRKINYRFVGSLNETTRRNSGEETELPTSTNVAAEVETKLVTGLDAMPDRVRRSLKRLQPVEQQVALLFASGLTWAQAAQVMGMDEAAGNRIRRKAQRLAREHLGRQKARMDTVNAMVAE